MRTPALPPILCYHKIERRREIGITRLSPRHFARQLTAWARDGWSAIGLEAIAQIISGKRVAGPKEFAITFDDAYRGLRDYAFPVLADLGFPGICAVITDYAGQLNRWDVALGGRRFAHLAWRDIERWVGRDIHFISHTATHPRLTWLDPSQVRVEYERSRAALAAVVGTPPFAIAYPWGAAGEREQRMAQDLGYTMGFMVATPSWRGDAMSIPRVPVYPWNSLRTMPRTSIVTPITSILSIAASARGALA